MVYFKSKLKCIDYSRKKANLILYPCHGYIIGNGACT